MFCRISDKLHSGFSCISYKDLFTKNTIGLHRMISHVDLISKLSHFYIARLRCTHTNKHMTSFPRTSHGYVTFASSSEQKENAEFMQTNANVWWRTVLKHYTGTYWWRLRLVWPNGDFTIAFLSWSIQIYKLGIILDLLRNVVSLNVA